MADPPVPMDTSDDDDPADQAGAGVIDATDPPTAADHAAPPPAAEMDTAATAADTGDADPELHVGLHAHDPGRPITPQEEEEARQAIDLLRGDDVAGRVEAANKLEGVAAALGVERTRDVSKSQMNEGMNT